MVSTGTGTRVDEERWNTGILISFRNYVSTVEAYTGVTFS